MFITHIARRCSRTYSVPLLYHFANGNKIFTKWVHSFHRFRPRKPNYNHVRKNQKSIKSDESLGQKVYTRDIVRNISNILRYSTWDSAKEQLDNLSIRWDSFTINQVLKTHPPMEKAWLFFNWASQLRGFKHDQFTYTTMLDIFGEARRISSMKFVFQQMEEKGIRIDAVTYTSLMHWLSNDGDFDGAVKVWEQMKDMGCCPTVVSYTAYMKVLFQHKRVREATEVYKEMLRAGYAPNCYTYTVLMENLAESGKYKEVLEIFDKMQDAGVQPDKASCNILVGKCSRSGETMAMNRILKYMKQNSLVLRRSVYLEAAESLRIGGASDVLLRQVNPHLCNEGDKDEMDEWDIVTNDTNSSTDKGLLLVFLERGNLVAIDFILASKNKAKLDSGIISTIIETNSAHGRLSGALLAFEYGAQMGIKIARTSYLALIGVFVRRSSFPKVVDVVEEMVKADISLGTYLGALLIYRLRCAKKVTSSAKIFDLLPHDQKNTATYTALMASYFSSGNANKGLATFTTMRKEGIAAALGTYSVILRGLEKCGRVQETEHFRKEKKKLQAIGACQDMLPVEEMICNRLFAGE